MLFSPRRSAGSTRRRASIPTQRDTLFDMASVSKLFTVTAFMTLVEEGRVALDTPVSVVVPEFSGVRPIQPYEDPLSSRWDGHCLRKQRCCGCRSRHVSRSTHPHLRPSGVASALPPANRRCRPPDGAEHLLLVPHRHTGRLQRHRPDSVGDGYRAPYRATSRRRRAHRVTAPLELRHTVYLPISSVEISPIHHPPPKSKIRSSHGILRVAQPPHRRRSPRRERLPSRRRRRARGGVLHGGGHRGVRADVPGRSDTGRRRWIPPTVIRPRWMR